MILKKTKKLLFLQNLLSGENPNQIDTNVFIFSSQKVGFFSFFLKDSIYRAFQDVFWVTSNSWVFKKNLLRIQPLYFLRKENGSYQLYDRRYLKTNSSLYLLPPVSTKLEFYSKDFFIEEQENGLLFPPRSSCFYCKGDTTDRLKNPTHLSRLQAKAQKKKQSLKLSEKIFSFLKEKLDS